MYPYVLRRRGRRQRQQWNFFLRLSSSQVPLVDQSEYASLSTSASTSASRPAPTPAVLIASSSNSTCANLWRVIILTTIMVNYCLYETRTTWSQGVFVSAASNSIRVVGSFVPSHHSSGSNSERRSSNIRKSPFLKAKDSSTRTQTLLPVHSPSSYRLPPASSSTISHVRPNRRIIAIGDVHADIYALDAFLQAAGVLADSSTLTNPVWDGGDTIVVQTGDILDRGDDELACIRVLTSLARQAVEVGGEVIMLHGNHEALNAVGMFRYVYGTEVERDLTPSIERGLGREWRREYGTNKPVRWKAFEPGGFLAKPLYGNMEVAVVIGRTVFVHAGLTAEHITYYGGIQKMNEAAKEWFTNSNYCNDGSAPTDTSSSTTTTTTTSAPSNTSPAQRRNTAALQSLPPCLGGTLSGKFSTDTSPVWMRDYSSPPDRPPDSQSAQSSIDDALRELGGGVRRMVVGHTPQRKINASLGGKAWRIDVGASRGVLRGKPEVLEIVHDGLGVGKDLIRILTVDGKIIPAEERMEKTKRDVIVGITKKFQSSHVSEFTKLLWQYEEIACMDG